MRFYSTIFIIFLCFMSLTTWADEVTQTTTFGNGFAKPAVWNRPLWADMHPNLVRIDFACTTNSSEYDWAQTGKPYRTFAFATLGCDIPVWSGFLTNNKFGLSVSMPFSVNIWLDILEPVTAPVVNTDYRIGFPEATFIHRLKNEGFLRNYSVRFAPFKHESTHIGDEITIMRKDAGLPLTRINVSYNYTELVATLNDADGSHNSNHCFRLGLMLLLNPKAGWYFIDETDGDNSLAQPKNAPYEIYLQYQYQTLRTKHHFQGIVSAEIRNRAKYGYPTYQRNDDNNWLATPAPETRAFTYNLFAGIRYCNPTTDSYFSKIGVGLRGYYGVAPYGQFRSHNGFMQAGISVIIE